MNQKKIITIIAIILLIDQLSKLYVKTHFELQEEVRVFGWFKILFVENNGMAWGAKLSDFLSFISDRTAKVILTSFRLIAISGIGYWLYSALKHKGSNVLILAIALIFAVAVVHCSMVKSLICYIFHFGKAIYLNGFRFMEEIILRFLIPCLILLIWLLARALVC